MKHLDLFSGIGGFAYAVDQVWDNVEHIFCDNDKFCRQVIKKHWPDSYIYEDIRAIGDTKSKRHPEDKEVRKREGSDTLRANSKNKQWRIDLLTGGFPCQPFSQAGKRRGTADDRHLWPEMLRVIQLTKPTWVIAENVRGLLTWNEGMVFEQVCADLEGEGYEVQSFVIPAVAVNAPHRRDRVWFIAHKQSERQLCEGQFKNETAKNRPEQGRRSGDKDNNDTHSTGEGLQRGKQESQQGNSRRPSSQSSGEQYTWDTDWLEVATELCRVDDGLPTELDYAGWTVAQHRVQRLKSLGNAIVPQVSIEIMKGIKASQALPFPF